MHESKGLTMTIIPRFVAIEYVIEGEQFYLGDGYVFEIDGRGHIVLYLDNYWNQPRKRWIQIGEMELKDVTPRIIDCLCPCKDLTR